MMQFATENPWLTFFIIVLLCGVAHRVLMLPIVLYRAVSPQAQHCQARVAYGAARRRW